MPAKTPLPQNSRSGKPAPLKDGSVESSLELPHERDQAVDMTDAKKSPLIEQAARDLLEGLEDTSKAPEMDRAYKEL